MANRALVIGSGTFSSNSGIPSHQTIRESARQYGEVLAADAMWGPGSRRVLDHNDVNSAERVMAALQQTVTATGPDDILLVVYVGHGHFWSDIPGGQVHFAVGSSQQNKPWTWLSSWYVYYLMRQAKARLKVLIVDCCYSDLLPQLGDELIYPTGSRYQELGTCVFTAVKTQHYASAEGCSALPQPFKECTPFSGHLLHILQEGTDHNSAHLTIGMLRHAVRTNMDECQHDVPRMSLNDAPDSTPLFTNRRDAKKRGKGWKAPKSPAAWISTLMLDQDAHLDLLLRDPRMAGAVAAELCESDNDEHQSLFRHLNASANQKLTSQDFTRYWKLVAPVLRG